MNFASANFQIAFAALLVLLVLLPPRWRIWSITLFSIVQLGLWWPLAVLIMLLVTLCVYALTLMDLTRPAFAPACWFPFMCWILFVWFRSELLIPLPLMIGPSFLFMRLTSLIVDVRRRVIMSPALIELIHYTFFFPLLAAGPVERFASVGPQLRQLPVPQLTTVGRGLLLFALGFFKKMFIADSLAGVSDVLLATPGLGFLDLCWAGLLVTTQVYADYSAYCEMGQGLALCLGVEIAANFLPFYLARTPVELWERWNRSVGAWFKDYVTFPLLLKWGRKIRSEFIILLTFVLMGLWHQLSWSRLGFGAVNGLFVIGTLLLGQRAWSCDTTPKRLLLMGPMLVLFACNGLFHVADDPALIASILPTLDFRLVGLTTESWWATMRHAGILLFTLLVIDYLVYSVRFGSWIQRRTELLWSLAALLWALALVLAKFTAMPFNYAVF